MFDSFITPFGYISDAKCTNVIVAYSGSQAVTYFLLPDIIMFCDNNKKDCSQDIIFIRKTE